MNTILYNKVKKGTQVRIKNQLMPGNTFMADNKSGVIRMIETPCVNGGTEIGSTYVDQITHALIDGEWVQMVGTPNQNKQIAAIRNAMW